MQKDVGTCWGCFEILAKTFKIEAKGLLFEVSVLSHLKTAILEDSIMISPCWIAEINWSFLKLGQEFSKNAKSSCSRESL